MACIVLLLGDRLERAMVGQPGFFDVEDRLKRLSDGTVPAVDLAIPVFGYQSHVGIDRGFGLIRTWKATDAAAYEGRVLREGLLDKTNTAGTVWAEPA